MKAAENTELVVPDEAADSSNEPRAARDVGAMIARLSEGKVEVYSTVQGTDYASKIVTLNAVTNAVPLADNLRTPFMLKDFVVEPITLTDDDGNPFDTVRTILITGDGAAFYAISDVLFKDLQRYTAILGHPSEWPEEGVKVVVDSIKNGKRSFFKMTLAG